MPSILAPSLYLIEGAAPVVAPMILQFFVLTILWVGTLPRVRPRGPGADLWGAVLLPFLMVSTGLLFFSAPLAPLWQPVLGWGGSTLGGFPAPLSLSLVLAMNLGVIGWCIRASGGLRHSPYGPLLLVAPILVGLMGGGIRGSLITAMAAVTLLVGLRAEAGRAGPGPGAPGPTLNRPPSESTAARGLKPAVWVGTLILLGIAGWLRP